MTPEAVRKFREKENQTDKGENNSKKTMHCTVGTAVQCQSVQDDYLQREIIVTPIIIIIIIYRCFCSSRRQ